MAIFGRKKDVLKAGEPIIAQDQERPELNRIVEEVSSVKEPSAAVPKVNASEPPKLSTPEQQLLELDWQEYNKRCSGVFNPDELGKLGQGVRDMILFELLFSNWRELKLIRKELSEIRKIAGEE